MKSREMYFNRNVKSINLVGKTISKVSNCKISKYSDSVQCIHIVDIQRRNRKDIYTISNTQRVVV